MLARLDDFLPVPTGTLPPPGVSVVQLQEKQIGLGGLHAVEERHSFPVVYKGIRLSGTVRFQLWGDDPGPLETQLRGVTEAVLAGREALQADGFVDLSLTDVSTTNHLPAVPAWRQTAEFDVLYEFRSAVSDLAGGLIARVPVEFREEWGALLVTGDLTLWDSDGTRPLVVSGRGSVAGLATLAFANAAAFPPGAVTLTRTFEGASGLPTPFGNLDLFLAAVAGSPPVSANATVSFDSLGAFLAALGVPEADPVTFVDEAGAPRALELRSRTFDLPVELESTSSRLEIAFAASQLSSGQVVYLRASRGQTP